MTKGRSVLLAAGAAATLAVAGCGGSGGGGGQSGGQAMSPQQFRAEVKQACSSTKLKLQGAQSRLQAAGKDPQQVGAAIKQVAGELQAFHDRLAKLQPPPQEAKGYQAYVSNLGRLHDQYVKFGDDVARKDKQAAQRDGVQLQAANQQSKTLARQAPALRACQSA